MKNRAMFSCFLPLLGAYLTAPALAETPSFQIKLGGFAQTTEATVASGRDDGGTELSLDALGHDDSNTDFWISGKWEFNDRWQLWGSASRFNSRGIINRNFYFEFEDVDIPDDINSIDGSLTVDSAFSANLYIVNLGYELYQSPTVKIDAGLGIHVVEFGMELDAELSANDRTESLGSGTSDVTAPLPNLVLFGQWQLAPRLQLSATAGWLSVNYDEYDGKLTALDVEADYALTDHLGLGAGYRWIDYDVTKEGPELTSAFSSEFTGPSVYAVIRF